MRIAAWTIRPRHKAMCRDEQLANFPAFHSPVVLVVIDTDAEFKLMPIGGGGRRAS